jgi:hypothetical protein
VNARINNDHMLAMFRRSQLPVITVENRRSVCWHSVGVRIRAFAFDTTVHFAYPSWPMVIEIDGKATGYTACGCR